MKSIRAPKTSECLTIDLNTELHIEIIGVIEKFKSTLIGIKVDKFIIVDLPSIFDTNSKKIIEKNLSANVIVRYVYKGTAYGFKSNLMSLFLEPTPMLFLRYPINVEKHNLRRQRRMACRLPGKIKLDSDIFVGIVLDISTIGAQIEIVPNKYNPDKLINSLKKNNTFAFLVQLPREFKDPVLRVDQKNIRSYDEKLYLGLEFHGIKKGDEHNISQFIDYKNLSNLSY